MATEIVGSLFGVTPEMYQQRQAEMADRQALDYAQLSPLQRASYGIARGGYQLAGALGGQDPQLQMISRRQAIARQIDPTNLNSMQMGIQALAQAGDQVGAMQLSQVLRQAENDIALRSQREASATASLASATRERTQSTPEKIQLAREFASRKGEVGSPEYEAEYNSQLTRLTTTSAATSEKIQLARELAARRGAPGTPEYEAAYNSELNRLTTTAETQTPEMRNAAALASLKGVPGSPEYAQEFQSQLSRLTAKTEVREPMTPEMRNASALASLKGSPGSPEYAQEYNTQLSRLTTRAEAREPTTNEITNARAVALQAGPVGSPEYNASFNAEYNRLTAPREAREPTTNEITNARAVAAQAGPVGSPEYTAAFRAEYNRLTAPKEGREPTTSELTNARAIARRAGPEGSQEYNAAFDAEYSRLTTRAEGREPTTSELTNARAIALRAGPVGSDAYNAAFDSEYQRLTTKTGAGINFGIDRNATAIADYGKPFAELTQAQQQAVNKKVAEVQKDTAKASATTVTVPGQRALADIPAFRRNVQATIDPQLKAINAADQALTAINDSLATNNFASFRAAQVQFARAIAGAGDLSQKELRAAGADPSLIGGATDVISTAFTSTPSVDTQKKLRETLRAIRSVAQSKANAEINQQRKIALRQPGYDVAAVNDALTFEELTRSAPTGSAAQSVADQARAELARRQSGGR